MGSQRVRHHYATELSECTLKQTTKIGSREEIIKIRAEISEIEMKKTKAKINETKRKFFEKINTIHKPLVKLKKSERT